MCLIPTFMDIPSPVRPVTKLFRYGTSNRIILTFQSVCIIEFVVIFFVEEPADTSAHSLSQLITQIRFRELLPSIEINAVDGKTVYVFLNSRMFGQAG